MSKFTVDSKYLKHTDLLDQDVVVTIARYKLETMEKNDKKEKKWILFFREDINGDNKGLVLNKVNGMTICKLYGDEMDSWIGKRICLYTKDDVEFGGELVSAIRVRPKQPL